MVCRMSNPWLVTVTTSVISGWVESVARQVGTHYWPQTVMRREQKGEVYQSSTELGGKVMASPLGRYILAEFFPFVTLRKGDPLSALPVTLARRIRETFPRLLWPLQRL